MSGEVPNINLQAQNQVSNKRSSGRPKNEPADNEEFKKVMEIDPDETNDKPKHWKRQEGSIFDIAKKDKKEKPITDPLKPSLLDLAAASKTASRKEVDTDLDTRTGDEVELEDIMQGKKQAKGESEQHHQSSHIAPIIQENTIQIEPSTTEFSAAQKKQADLIALVKEIVASMQQIQKSDRTEILITLKNGIFAGAQLQVTEFLSAKGEFTIDFFGLKAEAKALVDDIQSQNALKAEMQQQGFIVHKFTTTEEPIKTLITEADPQEEHPEDQDNPQDQHHHPQK